MSARVMLAILLNCLKYERAIARVSQEKEAPLSFGEEASSEKIIYI